MMRKHCDIDNGFLKGNAVFWRARRGFVLPLVFGAMAVLTLYFFIMSFLSSGQTMVASHFIDSSHSLSIAKAGADWAVTKYASGSYEPDNPICEALFGNSTAGGEFELQYPGELLDYVDNELNGELAVKMKIYDVTRIAVPEGLAGFQQDPVEKSGVIEFTSIGKVGKASRKVRIKKGFKVVMIVHPVVSKFTLFIREMLDGQDLNVLERKTSTFAFDNGSPIILNNQGFNNKGENLSYPVITPSTQEFDLLRVANGNFAKLVQSSGWVFLNSATTVPWTLNLSGGGDYSEFDDRLLLRVGMYEQKSLANIFPAKAPTGEVIERMWQKFQGMKTDYETLSEDGEVRKKPSDVLYLRYLFPNAPPKISLLRLFGTGTKFSPTMVFGPVYMQYLILRGMDVIFQNAGENGEHKYSNVLIPGFFNQADFTAAFRPSVPDDVNMAGFARVLQFPDRNNASSVYPDYSQIMTQIASRPYLDALDYIFLRDFEKGTMLRPKPPKEYDIPLPKMIDGNISPTTSPWIGNRDSLFKANGSFGIDNTILYSGELADISGCKEFQAKITAVFPSFAELKKDFFDKDTSQLRLPGIVYLGQDDLIIDEDLQITSPGMIICGGNVIIKSAVKSRYPDPVTIVSLKDITVESNRPIEAHLICLLGKFRATNGFNIKGGLAARSIDTSNMKANEKSITFEPAHDPYNDRKKWSEKTAYRYQLSQEEEYYVEGGN
ncbi:MAG: hypothetical protein A2W80_04605 [Candidatus Riflebacteria bacterium GWC2_50_8]|nr:MAG: hypothetical protein A2W80_04605 [Candidatus Riflebacteria bacterium GWC2_50_8]